MQAIGADQPTLADIHAERTALLAQLAGSAKPADQPSATASQGAFDPGQLVRLKAQPTVTGAVVARVTADPEDRYQVFHDGAVATYYASQIEPAARPSVTPAALHAALTAAQLRHPSIGNLYSLFASRIQFVPYQFRPVIKLIQADRPRLLIADEVGVGKTIEAGLILKELQARRELRTVLVICPKPLVAERKWLEEMKRFDERFDHLDGPTLRYCIEETHLDGVWPQQYARAILPYSLLDEALLMGDTERRRPRRGLLGLDPPPAFDLVIVDEAHHIRNTETWAYRAVRWFCDNAEAVVRIEATPVQLGDPDLYTLLHLLLPDLLPSSRELASRVFGLASYLESILDRHLSQLEYPSRHRPRPRCGSGLDQGPQSWRHWNNERQKALRAPSDLPLRPDRNGHLATPAGRRGAPARAEVPFSVYSGPAAYRRLRQRARQGRPQAPRRTGRTLYLRQRQDFARRFLGRCQETDR
jgi:hypothetical protein